MGGAPGKPIDIGLTSDVTWRIVNQSLIREETLTANKPLTIRSWRLSVPTTYSNVSTLEAKRVDRFFSHRGALEVQLSGESFAIKKSVMATGDGALGRGVHGPIPLHLRFEAENLVLQEKRPLKYRLTLTPIVLGSVENSSRRNGGI